MPYKWICPVCGFRGVENTWNDYMDHIMMESLNECVLCGCYSDYFATGNTEEVIGKYIFFHGWHGYNPPTDDEIDLHEALRQIAINNTRRELGIEFAHGAIAVSQL